MREQLNNNPVVQLGVVAVLLVAAAVFFLGGMGGGGEEAEEADAGATSTSLTSAPPSEAAATGEATEALSPGAISAVAPPLPKPVLAAWESNRTVVLLFVRGGGIDDRLVRDATAGLTRVPDVAEFIVPAAGISHYAAITEGVGVDRVPALVVLTPKNLTKGVPTASVHYGYQSAESLVQAVVDAGYHGRTLEYHP